MMRAVRFSGDETFKGEPLWVVVEHVAIAVTHYQNPAHCMVFFSGGDEDGITIYLKVDEVMTRLGFNGGSS